MRRQLSGNKLIDKSDLNIVQTAKTADQAVKYITDFYKIYHSMRYAGGKTILRLNREISAKTLKAINREFTDILINGKIEPCPPAEDEVKDSEHLDLPRLSMHFNLHGYSRLCEMIRAINKD
ncbi:MAG: hypothetical protein A2Z88_05355 [Omnitrophica WOR_2 bacterium GWA2_47_8]|nr:MAG: hypothetical protein A2Z88_05355 [Omnitrophica WOR_2 bacterium GWA2_47_8]